MRWLALDIGGANIKLADGLGFAQSEPFALWKEYAGLSQQLRTLIVQAPASTHLAVTMTGEIADCFASRQEGIEFILNALEEAADGRHTRVYRTDGKLVTAQAARRTPELVAASNWHALARFAGRYAETGPALVIDVGGTTTDIIPLADGQPVPKGRTDTARLQSSELVYTGVDRSPVCAVVQSTTYRGQAIPVAQEVFATMRDVYLILKDLPEEPTQYNTADGRQATKSSARTRLSRMLLADADQFNHRDAVTLAQSVAEAQLQWIASAVQRVARDMIVPPEQVIISGQGEFVARRVAERVGLGDKVTPLGKKSSIAVSRSACAHGLAVLANEAMKK